MLSQSIEEHRYLYPRGHHELLLQILTLSEHVWHQQREQELVSQIDQLSQQLILDVQ